MQMISIDHNAKVITVSKIPMHMAADLTAAGWIIRFRKVAQ